MAVFRYLVDDVDSSLKFYNTLGFKLTDRWGPPFAIVSRDDVDLWLSGPGTSAAKKLTGGAKPRSGGWNRLVITVKNFKSTLAALKKIKARLRSDPITGPGGI